MAYMNATRCTEASNSANGYLNPEMARITPYESSAPEPLLMELLVFLCHRAG